MVRSFAPLRSEKGFSMMELLTVIFIMAVIAGIMLPALRRVREGGRITHARNEINQLITAIQMYGEDQGMYPNDDGAAALAAWGDAHQPGQLACANLISELEAGGYAEWPSVVLDGDDNLLDPWGHPYRYRHNTGTVEGRAAGVVFNLYSAGPDGIYGTEDDITNW